MRLDDAVGDFSSRYEEAIYALAFHDGLEMGMGHRMYQDGSIKEEKEHREFTEKDMIQMIYMYDAYRELCTVLLGTVLAPELKDGVIGAFSRTLAVIEAHVPADMKEDDPKYDKILHDRSMKPEERAKLLLN